ncbi:hypothetical protein D3C87_1947630 [compost metagenome]
MIDDVEIHRLFVDHLKVRLGYQVRELRGPIFGVIVANRKGSPKIRDHWRFQICVSRFVFIARAPGAIQHAEYLEAYLPISGLIV